MTIRKRVVGLRQQRGLFQIEGIKPLGEIISG
jgi:hypothetical protein